MGAREAWGIVGGAAPDATDSRFDCVGALTKSNFGPENSRGSFVLVAPNVIVTAKHTLNSCNTPPNSCPCNDDYIEPGAVHIARFRRLVDGTVGVPGTAQYEVPIVQWHFPPGNPFPDCLDNDYAIGILAWNVEHIEPAVIDYSEIYDPPDNSNYTTSPSYGEFFIAGWGRNGQNMLPGTLLVGSMTGRPSLFGVGSAYGLLGDSGGGVLYPGSCGKMRLVGIIQLSARAVRCYKFVPAMRALIPPPPICQLSVSAAGMPDPVVTGRVTATGLLSEASVQADQVWNAIPSGGWQACAPGTRCADGVSRGTSAGVSAVLSSPPNECWYQATATASGTGQFDLSVSDRLALNFSVSAIQSASAVSITGGGTEPKSLSADSAFGCPTNSDPFQIDIPLQVSGVEKAVIRIAAYGIVRSEFTPPSSQTAPPPRPDLLIDVRTAWDLFQDVDENGIVSPLDILVNHAEGSAFEESFGSQPLVGMRLRSVDLGPGRYVLRVVHTADIHLRATVKGCDPPEVSGQSQIDTQLRVELIADTY